MAIRLYILLFLFSSFSGMLFSQSRVHPSEIFRNKAGDLIHPKGAYGPTYYMNSAGSNLDSYNVFPTCCVGDFYIKIEFGFATSSVGSTSEWELEIDFDFRDGTTVLWSETASLSSFNKTVTDVFYNDDFVSSENTHNYNISITAFNFTGSDLDVLEDIYLGIEHNQLRQESFVGNITLNPDFDIFSRSISWNAVDPAVLVIDKYEVEWVFQPSYEGIASIESAFDVLEPTRISTLDNYYQLDQLYNDGYIWIRVRYTGLSADYPDHILYGDWNYYSSTGFVINDAGNDNWKQSISYAEEGKNKKLVEFFDGSLRPVQTLTNLSSQNDLLIAEYAYDVEGRKTVDFLPFPTANVGQSFSYLQRNQLYKEDFDNGNELNPPLLPQNSNTEAYYSALNPDAEEHPHVAQSEGYPYRQVSYSNDGLNRPVKESGIGADYNIDGGRTTRYYYGSASKEELRRLFGDTFGNAKFYTKQLVQDPNGQVSVTYKDPYGRTVITSLAGEAPPNQMPLVSNISQSSITVSLDDKFNDSDNSFSVLHQILNVEPATSYDFSSNISSTGTEVNTVCMPCEYETSFSVMSPQGEELASQINPLNADDCANQSETDINQSTVFNDVGQYLVSEKIKYQTPALDEVVILLEQQTDVQIHLQNIEDSYVIDETNCHINVTIDEFLEGQLVNEVYLAGCDGTKYQIIDNLIQSNPGYDEQSFQSLDLAFDYLESQDLPEGVTSTMISDIKSDVQFCEYEFCIEYEDSFRWEAQMMTKTALSMLTNYVPEQDPFFLAGAIGAEYLLIMQFGLDNYSISYVDPENNTTVLTYPIASWLDETNSDLFVDDNGYLSSSSGNPGYHMLFYDILRNTSLTQVEKDVLIEERKLILHKGFYTKVKNDVLLLYATNIACVPLIEKYELITNQPSDPEDIEDAGTESGVLTPITDAELDALMANFQFECELSTDDYDDIREHLRTYFDSHPENVARVISSGDAGRDPSLLAIWIILEAYDCHEEDFVVLKDCSFSLGFDIIYARVAGGEGGSFEDDCSNPFGELLLDLIAKYQIACESHQQLEKEYWVSVEQEEYLYEIATDFLKTHKGNCSANLQASLDYTFEPKEYHYTLYYYDRAGNITQTVPPKGVTTDNSGVHQLATRYKYNSRNQLVSQNSPDGGLTEFYYNSVDQLRLSQNAEQRLNNRFSYTNYDKQNRVVESGEIYVDPLYTTYLLNNLDLYRGTHSDNGTSTYDYEVQDRFIFNYSNAYPEATFAQTYLHNRVSWVESDQTVNGVQYSVITYYSYDPHGNVQTVVQVLPGSEERRIDYIYDLVSGNVKFVYYQKGLPDQFIHQYEYDEDNRITEVKTSYDEINWDIDASYDYYAHGPLKRSSIGHYYLQGMDYVYTLQGWLKAINAPWTDDPGEDNGALFAKDAFSMIIGYNANDYKPIDDEVADWDTRDALWTRYQEQFGTDGLYNGNIGWLNTHLSSIGVEEDMPESGMQAKLFEYDQLNRILRSHALNDYDEATGYAVDNSGAFNTSYSYDPNGNLLTLNRKDDEGLISFDGAYTYEEGTNRLLSVNSEDIENLSFSNRNFDGAYTATDDYEDSSSQPPPEVPVTQELDEALATEETHKIVAADYVLLTPGFSFSPGTNGSLHILISDDPNELPPVEPPPITPVEGPVYTQITFDSGLDPEGDFVAIANESVTFKPGFSFQSQNGHLDVYLTSQPVDNETLEGLYDYDAIGNMISDQAENNTIEWNASGKVERVTQVTGEEMVFLYDGAGNRVAKLFTRDGVTRSTEYVRDASGNIMSIYTDGVQTEVPIYGSSRLGTYMGGGEQAKRQLGHKHYELTNHLGNIMAVISDDFQTSEDGDKQAVVIKNADYYPFGMEQPGTRAGDLVAYNGDYRYGFNGKERDPVGEWGGTSLYDYGFRIYNPSLGKFLSVDPLTSSYPWYTPYQFAGNKPIWAIDLDGLEELIYTKSFSGYKFSVLWSAMESKHLAGIMESVSRPERAKDIKIYFTSTLNSFGKENGSTINLISIASSVQNFEGMYGSDVMSKELKLLKLMNDPESKELTYQYIDYMDILEGVGMSAQEILDKTSKNEDLKMYAINLQKGQVGFGAGALKTFYHELELHLSRKLGERMNPGGEESGTADHAYGHAFYKNIEYYKSRGYTEEDLLEGFSPMKEDIVDDSPTGITNKEVDKIYED